MSEQKSLPGTVSHSAPAKSKTVRGYYIRTVGYSEETQLHHAWSEIGVLPAAWEETKADPAVREAQIFYGNQRHKAHQFRKLLASYSKQTSVVA